MNADAIQDLNCSGCGKDKNELAVLRSGDDIVALFCKRCLQDAIDLIVSMEGEGTGGKAN